MLGLGEDELRRRHAATTAREIGQQPRLWRQVGTDVARDGARTTAFLAPLLERPDLRVVLAGAGTSAFAGQVLAPALRRRLGLDVDAVATTDAVAAPREAFTPQRPTLLVSFARSGDSPESLATTALADELVDDLHHLVVTCNPDGALAEQHGRREDSLVLLMPEGSDDAGFAMTSSFTCMVLATWLVLTGAADPGASDPVQVCGRLAAAGEDALPRLDARAAGLAAAGRRRWVYLGSGSLAGLARESALKLLELTAGAVTTTADTALGFRHGPKAVLDGSTTAVVYVSNDPGTRAYDEDIVVELRAALGADAVTAVLARPSARLGEGPVASIAGVDDLPDPLVAVVAVTLAQLVGLHVSLALGREPDDPFPAGQVNRVVQGVTVHPLPGSATDRRDDLPDDRVDPGRDRTDAVR
ncbi:SIS domain-containing protein [Pseudokineococcus basanitobsidens]|uniref:SIS domain-containing protein n=1 Tax=Pseudokineococcus basanitobsidens TaxID=1926649 RepID=UPI003BB66959